MIRDAMVNYETVMRKAEERINSTTEARVDTLTSAPSKYKHEGSDQPPKLAIEFNSDPMPEKNNDLCTI